MRIVKKFHTAVERSLPPPELLVDEAQHEWAVIAIGTTVEPLHETIDRLKERGLTFNVMRLRSFPFSPTVKDWIEKHQKAIVIDQNRDGQLRSLLITELDLDPRRLKSLCLYDGMPLMAKTLCHELEKVMKA